MVEKIKRSIFEKPKNISMKRTLQYVAAAMVCFCAMLGGACSDGNGNTPLPDPDDPTPPEPEIENLIPLLEEAPSEYSGFEYLTHDTIINGAMGGSINTMIPVFKIIEHYEDGTSELTTRFDDEFFIEYKGGEYRYGDVLPISFRDAIQRILFSGMPGPELEIDGISLGTYTDNIDDQIVLNWPQKDLKIFIRLFRGSENVELPANWHGNSNSDSVGGVKVDAGMYVNGIGASSFAINVKPDGGVYLTRLDKSYHVNLYCR